MALKRIAKEQSDLSESITRMHQVLLLRSWLLAFSSAFA